MIADQKTTKTEWELLAEQPWPDMPEGPVSLISRAGRARLSLLDAQHKEQLKAAED